MEGDLNSELYFSCFVMYLLLVIAIAKCQRAKILPIRARCSICFEMSWITVIHEKYFELNSIA